MDDTTTAGYYANVPSSYHTCLSEGCTAAGQCLRYQAALALMERDRAFMVFSPKQVRPLDGTACPHYVEARPVQVARGFKQALGTLPANNIRSARFALMGERSRRTYYRMLNGEVALDAKEQQRVSAILAHYGARQPVVFDAYEYVMPW